MKSRCFIKKSPMPFSAEDLFDWHARPGAIERLTPPWVNIGILDRKGGLETGATVLMKMGKKPFDMEWLARHIDFEYGKLFRDTQVKGPFHTWTHTHLFHKEGATHTLMEDRIDYKLPVHPLGNIFAGWYMDKALEKVFTHRHKTVYHDMNAHQKSGLPPLRILISGASGLIGSALTPYLTTGGHQVIRLVRTKGIKHPDEIFWDPSSGHIDTENLEPVDVVIHLAGENIGQKKWTPERKRSMIESRTKSTTILGKAISNLDSKPSLFICASAIGYYGDRKEDILTEDHGPGDLFISGICKTWEACAKTAVHPDIRTAFMRIGIGLTPKGGALGELLFPFKMGMGAKIGNGNQYMSWIGIDDILDAFLHVIKEKSLSGPVNVVAPQSVTNREFTKIFSEVLCRPAVFTIPEKAIDLLLGQMGREILLSSTRVKPEKLIQTGFTFRSENLYDALKHMLGKS